MEKKSTIESINEQIGQFLNCQIEKFLAQFSAKIRAVILQNKYFHKILDQIESTNFCASFEIISFLEKIFENFNKKTWQKIKIN